MNICDLDIYQLRLLLSAVAHEADVADSYRDQLAKAQQLWQVAQGRCDGLEEEIQKLRQDLLTSYGEREELSGQLASCEQRVAEACAEFLESLAWRVKPVSSNEAAIEIRSGEYRKFRKGE